MGGEAKKKEIAHELYISNVSFIGLYRQRKSEREKKLERETRRGVVYFECFGGAEWVQGESVEIILMALARSVSHRRF